MAAAFTDALYRQASIGQIYELCGPKVYSLRQLVEYTGRLIGCRRPLLALSTAWPVCRRPP